MSSRSAGNTPDPDVRELLKGSTPTLILAILDDGPRHGYAIVREIERRSGARLSLGEGSLYPALHGMERNGLLSSQWETPAEGGANRKIYTLTEAGKGELARRLQTWRDFVQSMESVFGDLEIQPEGIPHAKPA